MVFVNMETYIYWFGFQIGGKCSLSTAQLTGGYIYCYFEAFSAVGETIKYVYKHYQLF